MVLNAVIKIAYLPPFQIIQFFRVSGGGWSPKAKLNGLIMCRKMRVHVLQLNGVHVSQQANLLFEKKWIQIYRYCRQRMPLQVQLAGMVKTWQCLFSTNQLTGYSNRLLNMIVYNHGDIGDGLTFVCFFQLSTKLVYLKFWEQFYEKMHLLLSLFHRRLYNIW